MSIREMIRRAAKQEPPRKEQEQAARRPDRTPPDDRPRPTEERCVLVRLPRYLRDNYLLPHGPRGPASGPPSGSGVGTGVWG